MILDAHCDTLSAGLGLLANTGHFDMTRAVRAGYSGQVFAAYGPGKREQLRRLAALARIEGFTAIPAVEGADEARSLADIDGYAGLGVRLLGLTWNSDNALAGGCGGAGGGLTELGREVVEYCAALGMLVDLSHCSQKTFEDVAAMRRGPLAVTHACCAALNPHRRNLTDSQLRAVAESGGVVGICYYPPFLTGRNQATLGDIAAHIAHAVRVAGSGHVGLGSDFDGCAPLPDGMDGVQSVPRLLELLPFSADVVDMIAGGNWRRLLLTH